MAATYDSSATSASPVYPETITGFELNLRVGQSNPAELALLAHALHTGTIRVKRFTNKQARP